MPQEGTVTVPPTGLGKVSWGDIGKSIFIAAIANVLLTLYPIIQSGAWPTTADWQSMAKSTVATIIAYLIKNFVTNNAGELFTKDKTIVKVPQEQLETLKDEANKTT